MEKQYSNGGTWHQKVYLSSLHTRVEVLVVIRYSQLSWESPFIQVLVESHPGGMWNPLVSHLPMPDNLAQFIENCLIGFDGALQEHD